ncbi:trehalose-phosphatase [bacterium]|nr:trehalose-phosphatase [bacterium]
MMELIKKYREATSRLILLDYDGTLVNYFSEPGAAVLPENLTRLLTDLLNTPNNEVYIITGRSSIGIDRVLNSLQINIIAEHGAVVRVNGLWKNKISDPCLWKGSIMPVLNRATLKCPGSFVEEKRFSLAWHYRNSDPATGQEISAELIESISRESQAADLKILNGNKVIEILKAEVGKGSAVNDLLEHKDFDFILSAGDDATDEEMFESLADNQNAFTIKVGNGETCARYKFADVFEVERLLQKLTG